MSLGLKTRTIELTQGRVALVSAVDYEALHATKWHAVKCSNRWYARRGMKRGGRMEAVYMHRQVLGLGPDDIEIVDHINGDSLDNTRENIRATSHSQNSLNIQETRGKTGLRGVYLQAGKYMVRIADEYCGLFDTAVEAAYHANVALDRLSPGAGMRNPVDTNVLVEILRSRRNEIDSLLQQVLIRADYDQR